MEYLYHGSATAGIAVLEARSTLHGTDTRVVYLTDCVPYALFYIWDEERTGSSVKHVTGRVEDGTAIYEEQFPDQLRAFYDGVSGWLYRAPREGARAAEGRESLFYAEGDTPVEAQYVPDVYAALLEHEAGGRLKVLRYSAQPPQRQEELTQLIAEVIRRDQFYSGDPAQRAFMKRYFARAWAQAKCLTPSSGPATPWPRCP